MPLAASSPQYLTCLLAAPYKYVIPSGSIFHNILTPEGSHVYCLFSPWRHKSPNTPIQPLAAQNSPIYLYAPGCTKFPHIIYFVSARVNILFQTIPLDGLPSKKDIQINNGFPTTCVSGTNPQKRLSSELCLLSPIIQ